MVLEQLLLRTRLPLRILDPNADFVGLGSPRDNADEAAAARIRAADLRVLQSSAGDGEPLRVRFVDLDLRSKGAVLRLDPVAHPDEYNVLLHLEDEFAPMGEHGLLEALRTSGSVRALERTPASWAYVEISRMWRGEPSPGSQEALQRLRESEEWPH